MISNVDIAISIDSTFLLDRSQILTIHLPRRATVDALDSVTPLACSPLLEAGLVHVVAACRLAPDYLIVLLIKAHVAN